MSYQAVAVVTVLTAALATVFIWLKIVGRRLLLERRALGEQAAEQLACYPDDAQLREVSAWLSQPQSTSRAELNKLTQLIEDSVSRCSKRRQRFSDELGDLSARMIALERQIPSVLHLKASLGIYGDMKNWVTRFILNAEHVQESSGATIASYESYAFWAGSMMLELEFYLPPLAAVGRASQRISEKIDLIKEDLPRVAMATHAKRGRILAAFLDANNEESRASCEAAARKLEDILAVVTKYADAVCASADRIEHLRTSLLSSLRSAEAAQRVLSDLSVMAGMQKHMALWQGTRQLEDQLYVYLNRLSELVPGSKVAVRTSEFEEEEKTEEFEQQFG